MSASYLEVHTRYLSELSLQDILGHSQDSDGTNTGNVSRMQVGFGSDITGANALFLGVPGVVSTMLAAPGNPGGSKALVLSMGPGRKYVLGIADQTSPTVACAPGESALYGAASYTKCTSQGIETHAPTGDHIFYTSAHPGGLNFDSEDVPSIVAAYNDLAAKYQALLTLVMSFATTAGPVQAPSNPMYVTSLAGLAADPDYVPQYAKL